MARSRRISVHVPSLTEMAPHRAVRERGGIFAFAVSVRNYRRLGHG
jgi:hypothetical protein